MKFRFARHTTDLNQVIDFYGRVLGLKVLGEFKDHHGYSGVFMGIPGQNWHLEFTVSDVPPDHHPDDDDLLVFYASSLEEFAAMKTRFVKNKVKQVKPANPTGKKTALPLKTRKGIASSFPLSESHLHSANPGARIQIRFNFEYFPHQDCVAPRIANRRLLA